MYQHFGLTSGIMTIGFGITMWGKTIICKHELWFSSLCGVFFGSHPEFLNVGHLKKNFLAGKDCSILENLHILF